MVFPLYYPILTFYNTATVRLSERSWEAWFFGQFGYWKYSKKQIIYGSKGCFSKSNWL